MAFSYSGGEGEELGEVAGELEEGQRKREMIGWREMDAPFTCSSGDGDGDEACGGQPEREPNNLPCSLSERGSMKQQKVERYTKWKGVKTDKSFQEGGLFSSWLSV